MSKKKILVVNNEEKMYFNSLREAIIYAKKTYKQKRSLSAVIELLTNSQMILLCGKAIEFITTEELKKILEICIC